MTSEGEPINATFASIYTCAAKIVQLPEIKDYYIHELMNMRRQRLYQFLPSLTLSWYCRCSSPLRSRYTRGSRNFKRKKEMEKGKENIKEEKGRNIVREQPEQNK
jgi:hypothetical protein